MNWPQTRNLGMLLLGIWLIATGATAFVHVGFLNVGLILSIVAIVAGIMILLRR